VPDHWINLLRTNKDLINGFMIESKDVLVKLTKGETKLVFHHCLNTKGGFVSCVKMVPVLNQVNNTAVG
jgi:hypothetical protein